MKKLLNIIICSLFASHAMAQQGIKGEYFDGENFEKYVATRIDSKIDLSWLRTPPVEGVNAQHCSIRWTGQLTAPESGTFTFSAVVDDGIRVWVGNVPVIDAWGLHDSYSFTGKVNLEKDTKYDLKVEYFNGMIEGEIRLLWELPSEESIWGNFFGSNAKVIDSRFFTQTPEPVLASKSPTPPVATPLQKKVTPLLSKPKTQKPKQPANTQLSTDTIQKYTPKNVLFEKSKSIMLAESYAELDNLAAFLKRYPTLRLTIEGHTDNIGDDKLNLILSEERAKAVKDYLIQKGIATSRIEAKGYGSTQPLVKESTATGNVQNRRVEFVIR